MKILKNQVIFRQPGSSRAYLSSPRARIYTQIEPGTKLDINSFKATNYRTDPMKRKAYVAHSYDAATLKINHLKKKRFSLD